MLRRPLRPERDEKCDWKTRITVLTINSSFATQVEFVAVFTRSSNRVSVDFY